MTKNNKTKKNRTQAARVVVPRPAAVAYPMPKRKPNKGRSLYRVNGTDVIVTIDDVTAFDAKTLAFNYPVDCNLATRLKNISRNYERYRFDHLKFEVTAGVSSTTTGNYVLAFAENPEVLVGHGVTAWNNVNGNPNSIKRNWWEAGEFVPKRSSKMLYTQQLPNQSLKWSSDGALMMAVGGKASQAGQLTITCTYTVTFYDAIVQEEPEDDVVVGNIPAVHNTAIIWVSGNSNLGFVLAVDENGDFTHVDTAFPNSLPLLQAHPSLTLQKALAAPGITSSGSLQTPGTWISHLHFGSEVFNSQTLRCFLVNSGSTVSSSDAVGIELGATNTPVRVYPLWVKGQHLNAYDFKEFANENDSMIRNQKRYLATNQV